jgi:hypothetical protein
MAVSHIINATAFLPNMLVQKSVLQESPSPHTIPKNVQDAYRDANELPVGTLDTPVYWHLSPTDARANTSSTRIMGTLCFACSCFTSASETGAANVIVTQNPWDAANLLNATHIGRLFSVVDDPVERLVSEYYYRRQNENERLTLQDFLSNVPDNYLVRSLANHLDGIVDQGHLNTARALVKSKLLVGLLEEKTESLRRIDTYFGLKKKQSSEECRNSLLGFEEQRTAPQHEQIQSESRILVQQQNHFDVELYDYIKLCFREQTALFKQ